MKSLHPLVLALGLVLAIGATGCSTPCEDLGNRVCQCQPEGYVRTNCQTDVKARVRAAAPSGDEAGYCSTVLTTCPDPGGDVAACAWMLNTCAGKVACGLALPLPDGCFSSCQELGQRICQCVAVGPARDQCMTDVTRRAAILDPLVPEEQTCDALLLTCPIPWGDAAVCNTIFTTCTGEVACGLATPIPGGGCTPIVLTSPLLGAAAR